MQKYTIKDIAEIAGVSISTVSRVINCKENVTPDNVTKVKKAIESLNWQPNAMAQSLRRNQSQIMGLILPNTTDPFFGSIIDSIIFNASQQGFNILPLISRSSDRYDEVTQFKRLSEAGIDGLIYCSVASVDQKAFEYYFSNIPVIVCSRRELIPGRTHVYFNHQKGGYVATKHLLEMGHRKIAFFVGVFGNNFSSAEDLQPHLANTSLAGPYSGIDKYIGARRALDEMSMPFYPDLLEFIDLGNPYESGFLAMQRLISKTTDFDAVFCSNDLSATGAIHMLAKQKISVPDTVSVIGYDDGLMAICAQPQLSTVVQDTNKLGKECVLALKKLINEEPCEDVEIDVQLIVRHSSCKREIN